MSKPLINKKEEYILYTIMSSIAFWSSITIFFVSKSILWVLPIVFFSICTLLFINKLLESKKEKNVKNGL